MPPESNLNPQVATPEITPRAQSHTAFTLALFLLVSFTLTVLSFSDALIGLSSEGKQAFSKLLLESPLFDLYCYRVRLAQIHTPAFFSLQGFTWTYPAPCLWVYRFLYLGRTQQGIWLLYITSVAILLISAALAVARELIRAGLPVWKSVSFVVTTLILSWPIYFSVERGNIESLLWLALAVALTFYVQRRYTLAAIGIGVVAAFKLYPILFLALFLKREYVRQLLLGLLIAGTTTLLGLTYIGRHILGNAAFIRSGIRTFLSRYSAVYDPVVIGYDHSAWSLFKVALTIPGHSHPRGVVIYTLSAGLLAVMLFFGCIRGLPRKNQLLALSVLMVLLPSTSFDYTLQALYIPFAWLVIDYVRNGGKGDTRRFRLIMITFSLILAPTTFIHGREILHSGQAKALALLWLLFLAVTHPIFEETPTRPNQHY